MARERGLYRRKDSRYWWIASFSRMDDAYAKALGVSSAPMPKASPSA